MPDKDYVYVGTDKYHKSSAAGLVAAWNALQEGKSTEEAAKIGFEASEAKAKEMAEIVAGVRPFIKEV